MRIKRIRALCGLSFNNKRKRVVYSSGHNEISACHPDNYKVQHQTVGRRFLKEEPSDDDSDGENPSGYRNNTNTCMCNKSYSRPSLRKR